MKHLAVLVVALLLAGCGSSGQKVVVENPYAERMKELSSNGVSAMQRERWPVAEKLFERALQAAQLANDPELITRAWYNLGMLHVSAGNHSQGETALKRAAAVAEQHRLELANVRARIALALMYQKQGREAWQPDLLSSSYPADIHLAAARLSQLQKRYDVSRRGYEFVLRQKETSRAVMLYKIEAHMGLALLAEEQQEPAAALKEIGRVLEMSREIGAPRLAAHALLLRAKATGSPAEKSDDLQDALVIYQALDDLRGQKDTLQQLLALAEQQQDGKQDREQIEALQLQLQALERK